MSKEITLTITDVEKSELVAAMSSLIANYTKDVPEYLLKSSVDLYNKIDGDEQNSLTTGYARENWI
jgi:hypothetical protein